MVRLTLTSAQARELRTVSRHAVGRAALRAHMVCDALIRAARQFFPEMSSHPIQLPTAA